MTIKSSDGKYDCLFAIVAENGSLALYDFYNPIEQKAYVARGLSEQQVKDWIEWMKMTLNATFVNTDFILKWAKENHKT